MQVRPNTRLGAVLLLLITPTSLPAQTRAWADLDLTRVEGEGLEPATGMTLAPSLRIDGVGGATSLVFGAAYGRFESDQWAAQGTVDIGATLARLGPLRPDLSFSAAAFSQSSRTDLNLLALARSRLHYAGSSSGVWGGLGGGVGDDGDIGRGIGFADLGAWVAAGRTSLAGTFLPSTVGSNEQYLDAELAGRAVWTRLELTAGAGRRWWASDVAREDESWASVALEFRLFPLVAMTAAAGSFPTDPVRGFREGDYLQFGFRVGPQRGFALDAWALREAYRMRPPLVPPVVTGFEVRTSLAVRVIRIAAPAASLVEIAGDFTDWEPIPLTRAGDGAWQLERVIAAGTHRFNVRVNSGLWGVPPGVPTVEDDFGGVVALLIID
jgi:hypothetical protein